MTKKQLLSIIALWFFTIGVFGFGFSLLSSTSRCVLQAQDIYRITDIQDNVLLSFSVFGDNKKLSKLKNIIENRENGIKKKVELFKDQCKSSREQKQLLSILRQYGFYLSTKQIVLNEKQDFSWHEDLLPLETTLKR